MENKKPLGKGTKCSAYRNRRKFNIERKKLWTNREYMFGAKPVREIDRVRGGCQITFCQVGAANLLWQERPVSLGKRKKRLQKKASIFLWAVYIN